VAKYSHMGLIYSQLGVYPIPLGCISCHMSHLFACHIFLLTRHIFLRVTFFCLWHDIQPIPLGVSFSKAQSSKLERLRCHVSVKRDLRALSFELWNSIRKCHSKWDRILSLPSIHCEKELCISWKRALRIMKRARQIIKRALWKLENVHRHRHRHRNNNIHTHAYDEKSPVKSEKIAHIDKNLVFDLHRGRDTYVCLGVYWPGCY